MRRRGFTAVELMVVLALAGIIIAGIASVLRRQQRFFTNAASLVEQRVSLRDATGILPGELRAVAPGDGDVLAYSDSALDLRATIGTAIACDTVSGGSAIAIAPAAGQNRNRLTAFATSPQPGDIAVVYDAGSADASSDDRWISLDISSTASNGALCIASPFVDRTDPNALPILFRLSGSRVPPTVRPGAFVRVLRRVRYRFYRASTGDWYLGYAEWDGTAFGVVQPISGPFASYSTRSGSGLRLRYFDDVGTELFAPADAARIAFVSVVVRGAARGALSDRTASMGDSQSVGIRVRNR